MGKNQRAIDSAGDPARGRRHGNRQGSATTRSPARRSFTLQYRLSSKVRMLSAPRVSMCAITRSANLEKSRIGLSTSRDHLPPSRRSGFRVHRPKVTS